MRLQGRVRLPRGCRHRLPIATTNEEYHISSPAEPGYINVELTITDPENLGAMVDADGNSGEMQVILHMDTTPNDTALT